MKCEHGKQNYKEYEEYLETGDREKCVSYLKMVMRVLMKNSFLGCLDRSEEENNKMNFKSRCLIKLLLIAISNACFPCLIQL